VEEIITAGSQDNLGKIKISEDVIAIIAGLAAAEVPGIASMGGGIAGGIAEALGMKSLSKGVKVEVKENEVSIDLYIIVEYGTRIPEVAWNIQENVKKKVEDMTGLTVTEVNINVQGINIAKEKENKESKENKENKKDAPEGNVEK